MVSLVTLTICFLYHGALGFAISDEGSASTAPTIQQLKAAVNPKSTYVLVTGRDVKNDGGGGLFFWDSTETVDEDGGTIFASSLLPKTAAGRWKRVMIDGGALNVKWFGARGDATPDGGNVIQRVIDLAPSGASIYIPRGSYNVSKTIVVAGKSLSIKGDGEGTRVWRANEDPLGSLGNNSILKKMGHGTTLRVDGMKFDVQGVAISGLEFDDADPPASSTYLDLVVSNCTFVGQGVGIRLIKARESFITNCKFECSTDGIYLREATNVSVSGCFFHPTVQDVARGIRYDGDFRSPFNAGLRVVDCTFLGCAVGVDVKGIYWVEISSSVIDFCDLPINLVDADKGVVQSNFIGARRGRTTGTTYGMRITGTIDSVGHYHAHHMKVVDNVITTYNQGSYSRVGILADNVHGLKITGNTIGFWNDHGIENYVFGEPSEDPAASRGCQRVHIEDNTILSSPPNQGTPIRRPTSGEVTFQDGETSLEVVHGLGDAPERIFVTPQRPEACGGAPISGSTYKARIERESSSGKLRIFWKVEGK